MARLSLILLGDFQARLGSGAPLRLRTRKTQALLAYLASPPGQSHSRDKLAALLWGERSQQHARSRLRGSLFILRRVLAPADPPCLALGNESVALDAGVVDVDAVAFGRLVQGDDPDGLARAVEFYQGDLLEGLAFRGALFEDWLMAERERLRELAVDALARLLAHQTKAAATERAIQTSLRLLSLDPLQEAVHRTLMRLYARQGRRGAALRQYQACVRVLKRELGIPPEAATKQLYQDLLRRAPEVPEGADAVVDISARPVHAAEPAATDLPIAETPLFGRQEELGRLRQGLDEAIRGSGRIATVVGEAGIGKTRLVTALATDALPHGCRLLIGHCHESDSILPFGPWVDACRHGKVSNDPEILGALHPARLAEVGRLFPEVGRPGLPPAGDTALSLFEGVAELIECIAARQPLVLVLEDLHWADELTLRLLAFVGRRIPAWPVLLVATARPEELAEASLARRTLEDLRPMPHTLSVALAPLSNRDTTSLVRALTRVGSNIQAVAHVEAQIWAMSEGNPLVAVEAMRALDQDGLRDGACGEPRPLALPARVRELVARHLDHLSPRSQQMAAVAAVIGRRFDFTFLHAASGMAEQEAAEAAEELVRHQVLQTVGDELDFTHDRIRDVAYGRLLPWRRRLLHRAVVETLEMMSAHTVDAEDAPLSNGVGERVEQLADHAFRGELWDKALRYCRQAGVKAAARSAGREAVRWLEHALSALDHRPEDRAKAEMAIDLRFDLRSSLLPLGEMRRTVDYLREAEALAASHGDHSRLGRALSFESNCLHLLGEYDRAVELALRSRTVAQAVGDVRLEAASNLYLGQAHLALGDYRQAIEILRASLKFGEIDPGRANPGVAGLPVASRAWLAWCLSHVGDFDEALAHGLEGMARAEATDRAGSLILASIGLAFHYLWAGNLDAAQRVAERGLAICESRALPLLSGMLMVQSGYIYALSGQVQQAVRTFERGRAWADSIGIAANHSVGIAFLAHAYQLEGRIDDALRTCDEALALARRSKERGHEAIALYISGEIIAQRGPLDAPAVEARYRSALAIAAELGMRPLVAHCHLGLGKLYRRTGQRDQGREHVTIATAMYRQMNMRFWLERAHEDIGTLD